MKDLSSITPYPEKHADADLVSARGTTLSF